MESVKMCNCQSAEPVEICTCQSVDRGHLPGYAMQYICKNC